MKHTPGPWKHNEITQGWVENNNRVLVASAHCYKLHSSAVGISAEQMVANARLIAASPGLLKAMKNLLEDDLLNTFYHIAGHQAIAEAEGKLTMAKHTPNELDAQAVHVKALSRELCTRSAEYIVRACESHEALLDVVKPLLEAYWNMAQMLQTDLQFQGDQLTQRAEAAIKQAGSKL